MPSHIHRKRYVQGGLCQTGNGTKCEPWNSLSLAQSHSGWTTLIVLPSPIALDGGITLHSGQKLVGKDQKHAIITNSFTERNGGNGIIAIGNVLIKNVTIKQTNAAAVRYDNASNLTVRNTYVSGYNQSNITAPIVYPLDDSINSVLVGAFFGHNSNPGTTTFCHVTIDSGNSGPAIADLVAANRKLYVQQCKFNGLRTTFSEQEGLLTGVNGLFLMASNDAEYKVRVQASHLYDFVGNSFAPKDISIVVQGHSHANIQIEDCLFQESIQHTRPPVSAIEIITVNSNSSCLIKNNTFDNLFNTLTTRDSGVSEANLSLVHNNATGYDQFYAALAVHSESMNLRKHVTMKSNKFIGGVTSGAILIGSNLGGPASWSDLRLELENNCYDGKDIAFAAFISINFGSNPAGAGNATITGSHNNFERFVFDILDFGFFEEASNVNYLLPRNWWGQPEGPDNIDNTGTGVVDVSDPLSEPIDCPKFKYCLPTDQLTFGDRAVTVDSVKAQLEKIAARFRY